MFDNIRNLYASTFPVGNFPIETDPYIYDCPPTRRNVRKIKHEIDKMHPRVATIENMFYNELFGGESDYDEIFEKCNSMYRELCNRKRDGIVKMDVRYFEKTYSI